MSRKSAAEILNVSDKERHDWLITASPDELYAFLRLIKTDNSWAQHGRDALSVALARENTALQKEMKDMTDKMKKMTKWVVGLTVVITFLTFIQAYQGFKTLYSDIQALTKPPEVNTTAPQTNSANQQGNAANQAQATQDEQLNKTEIIEHKKSPLTTVSTPTGPNPVTFFKVYCPRGLNGALKE